MKNKFIDFIKKEKNFIFGIGFITIDEIFIMYHTKIFKMYGMELKHRLLIFITMYFSIEFYKKGLLLLFPKVEHRR